MHRTSARRSKASTSPSEHRSSTRASATARAKTITRQDGAISAQSDRQTRIFDTRFQIPCSFPLGINPRRGEECERFLMPMTNCMSLLRLSVACVNETPARMCESGARDPPPRRHQRYLSPLPCRPLRIRTLRTSPPPRAFSPQSAPPPAERHPVSNKALL